MRDDGAGTGSMAPSAGGPESFWVRQPIAGGEHRLDDDECRRMFELATYVNSVEESKALNKRQGPFIVISASGMLTGGRVLHHFKRVAPDPVSNMQDRG